MQREASQLEVARGTARSRDPRNWTKERGWARGGEVSAPLFWVIHTVPPRCSGIIRAFDTPINSPHCNDVLKSNLLQSPQFWPIPTRTTVLNRCTAAIHWGAYELSANQQFCGLQVVLAAIGQN